MSIPAPTKVEIAMSMLEREIVNLLARFGLADHPLAGIALDFGKKMYGHKIEAALESVLKSEKSIDAGTDVLKEGLGSCIDNFCDRLKERLKDSGAHNEGEA